jgi:hypothetical protein
MTMDLTSPIASVSKQKPGLPDFSYNNIQKTGENKPNCHKIFQMYKNYIKSSIARPSKNYPKLCFGFLNIPSGNPG